jgi:hypothetical protein
LYEYKFDWKKVFLPSKEEMITIAISSADAEFNPYDRKWSHV